MSKKKVPDGVKEISRWEALGPIIFGGIGLFGLYADLVGATEGTPFHPSSSTLFFLLLGLFWGILVVGFYRLHKWAYVIIRVMIIGSPDPLGHRQLIDSLEVRRRVRSRMESEALGAQVGPDFSDNPLNPTSHNRSLSSNGGSMIDWRLVGYVVVLWAVLFLGKRFAGGLWRKNLVERGGPHQAGLILAVAAVLTPVLLFFSAFVANLWHPSLSLLALAVGVSAPIFVVGYGFGRYMYSIYSEPEVERLRQLDGARQKR